MAMNEPLHNQEPPRLHVLTADAVFANRRKRIAQVQEGELKTALENYQDMKREIVRLMKETDGTSSPEVPLRAFERAVLRLAQARSACL